MASLLYAGVYAYTGIPFGVGVPVVSCSVGRSAGCGYTGPTDSSVLGCVRARSLLPDAAVPQ